MKTETCKLYSRDFWIFLPKIINIYLYNSELYRFKVGAFFETHDRPIRFCCTHLHTNINKLWCQHTNGVHLLLLFVFYSYSV